jgi:hypothetical protein
MSRAIELRAMLARCEARVRHAQSAFDAFLNNFDSSNAAQLSRRQQLSNALERAERDCEWAKEQLERALDRERVELGTGL